nr:LOW QUALITY PROTEIN: AP-4 complex subunit epsilon-like [Dermatophagoides farinae]
MPWSNQLNNCQQWIMNDRFSFGIMTQPSTNTQQSPQIPQQQQQQQQLNMINQQQSIDIHQNFSFNKNNKRHFSHLMSDYEDESNYDFDNNRPIKKYIGEDKVLEIFDRMHIREGENYIVEDADHHQFDINNQNQNSNNNNNNNHSVHIEEIDANNNIENIITNDDVQILELSPELRDAFANQQQQQSSSSSIMDKLIQAEKDKMSKALVVWQSNDLTNLIVSNHNRQEIDSNDDDNDDDDLKQNDDIRIEEPLENDDDQMFDDDNDNDDYGVVILETDNHQIEPRLYYQSSSSQDQPME